MLRSSIPANRGQVLAPRADLGTTSTHLPTSDLVIYKYTVPSRFFLDIFRWAPTTTDFTAQGPIIPGWGPTA